ncbi:UNVERIFIED_CONTAM: hypothetical protein Slati_3064400 [Sesamum latifolium]|uniref:Uncharacterized protein n=1 Tax=Sesamum latifolium TaxID=2727402 RepID=A0AAW2USR2_9LAMI
MFGKGHWKRKCPQLLSHPGMFVVEINMISNSASWVLDTGCGAHICNDLQVLQRSRKLSKDEMILRLGNGKAVAAEVVGSLSLVVSDHVRIELKDCYFVPSMVKNIISISILDRDGYKFLINKNYFYLVHEDVYHTLGTLVNGLYILQQSNLIMTAQHKRKVDDHENAQIWHARLGNISKDRIRKPAYVKRLVGDKLDSRSSLCRFIGYPKETAGYHFYDPAEQKVFVSRNAVFFEKGFPSDNQRHEVMIEESSGRPPHNSTASFEPTVHTDGVPILRRSTRESRVPERYGFVGLTSQLDKDPKRHTEKRCRTSIRTSGLRP